MHNKFSGWNYAFWFIVVVLILLGATRILAWHDQDRGLNETLRANRTNQSMLQRDIKQTNRASYEKQAAQQGRDLYRDLPEADRRITSIIYPAYTQVTGSDAYQKISTRIRDRTKGDLATTVLNNVRPQVSQESPKPTSPYADVKDIRVQDRYSNYNQGQVVVLTDISYQIPSRTVTDGRKFVVPGQQRHDYYLSNYDIKSGTFHVLTSNHSQSQGGA